MLRSEQYVNDFYAFNTSVIRSGIQIGRSFMYKSEPAYGTCLVVDGTGDKIITKPGCKGFVKITDEHYADLRVFCGVCSFYSEGLADRTPREGEFFRRNFL